MTLRGTWGLEGRGNFNVLLTWGCLGQTVNCLDWAFSHFRLKMKIAQLHMDYISPEVPQAHAEDRGGV